MTIQRNDPASFRDPSGTVYWENGQPYRRISHGYQEQYDQLINSGSYRELVDKQLLVVHEEMSESQAQDGS
jgi:hypothetical protein